MSEMTERAAKAMWEVRRAKAQAIGLHLEEWGDGYWPKANHIMEEARAAIEAMREPTGPMIDAAYEAVEFNDAWQITDAGDYLKALNAMISAALEDSK